MIRINLLPGKKKQSKGGGGGFDFSAIVEMVKQVKDPLMLGVIGSWVVGVGILVALYMLEGGGALMGVECSDPLQPCSGKIAEREVVSRALTQDFNRRRNTIRDSDIMRARRDSLSTELTTIRTIDADRFIWPHILEEVTKALPTNTWLTSIEAMPVPVVEDTTVAPLVRVSIEGVTSAVEFLTQFTAGLDRSPWLVGVSTPGANRSEEEGRPVFTFALTATFQVADSNQITVVPVAESVR